MRILYADLETFWSPTHTLSKLNPVAYCMHRDTEIQSMAYAWDNGPVEILWGEDEIRAWWDQQDLSDTMVVGHNMSQFDSMILAWRFGVRPKYWGCSLAMARPLYRAEVGGSLKALCDHLGLGEKGNLEAIGTKGRKLASFTTAERVQMAAYNAKDVVLCRKLFKHLAQRIPKQEFQVIDMTIRMLVYPKFRVDVPLLQQTLGEERQRKVDAIETLLDKLGLPFETQLQKVLMSNPQFANLLLDLGVDPPMKVSPTTGKETYAFAKNDEDFLALLEHDNELVAAAAATRLGIKSTLLESRIETFITMARASAGRMPIALNYYGAHTGRWSGGFKANQQNLPRVNPKEPKLTDALRACLVAPPGHKIVVADLSGIELRVNHFLWQVPSSMELYAGDAEADLYKTFAAKFYDIRVEQVSKEQRQFAKMMQLALGFGMGWKKFKAQAKLQGYDLSDAAARDAVAKWRAIYDAIAYGWELCGRAIPVIADGEEIPIDPWGHCTTTKYGINTPNGMLRYPDLRQQGEEWVYGHGRHQSRIYGPLLTENLVQHLARQVLVGQMLKIQKRYPISHTVHDEVILIVPEDEAQTALDFMLDTMKTPPDWWPELVLFAEGDLGDRYSQVK